MEDLYLLVADKNMQYTLRGILSRPEALGIREVQYECDVHAGRDGGVRTSGPEMLELQREHYHHALLILDFEGSGAEEEQGILLENNLDRELARVWADKAKAIVIEPEVDIWVWGSDNSLGNILGRPQGRGIREWLRSRDFTFTSSGKPERPKEAMEALLRELRCPRSSSIYQRIIREISLHRCTDPSFLRLRRTLVEWFPA